MVKCLIFLGLLFANSCFAQIDPEKVDFMTDEEVREMEQFINPNEPQKKIKTQLNDTSFQHWRRFPFLSEQECFAIIEHIQKWGRLFSKFEIHAVKNLSKSSKDDLLLMMDVKRAGIHSEGSQFPSRPKFTAHHTISFKFPRARGVNPESSSPFLGSPAIVYSRFDLKYKKMRTLIVAEKDAGEKFWIKKGHLDMLKLGVAFRNIGSLERTIIGSYQAQYGKQLVIGSPLVFQGFGVMQNKNFFNPDGSRMESAGFCGFGFRKYIHQIALDVLMSRKQLGATLDSNQTSYTSLVTNGLHRTANELSKRKQLVRNDAAIVMQRNGLGLIYRFSDFSLAYRPDPSVWNIYQRKAKPRQHKASVFLHKSLGAFYIQAEAATSASGGHAYSYSILSQLDPHLIVELHGLFHSLKWEGGKRHDEHIESVKYNLKRGETLSLSRHEINGLWPAFHKRDYATKTRYSLGYVKEKRKKSMLSCLWIYIHSSEYQKSTYRIQYSLLGQNNFRWINRLERNNYKDIESGMRTAGELLYSDFRLLVRSINLATIFRLSFSNFESSLNAISNYENNVLYTYSLTSQRYSGTRISCLLKWRPNQHWCVRAKCTLTNYKEMQTIGSGADERETSAPSSYTIQIQYKL